MSKKPSLGTLYSGWYENLQAVGPADSETFSRREADLLVCFFLYRGHQPRPDAENDLTAGARDPVLTSRAQHHAKCKIVAPLAFFKTRSNIYRRREHRTKKPVYSWLEIKLYEQYDNHWQFVHSFWETNENTAGSTVGGSLLLLFGTMSGILMIKINTVRAVWWLLG